MAIKGKIIVTNGIEAKRIFPEELPYWKKLGWHRGHTNKHNENTSKNSTASNRSIVNSIISTLDTDRFIDFYKLHTAQDTAKEFNIDLKYIYRIICVLGIPKHSQSESRKLQDMKLFSESVKAGISKMNSDKKQSWYNTICKINKERAASITIWNKGLTKYDHPSILSTSNKLSGRTGVDPWNKGLTKDTDERINKQSDLIRSYHSSGRYNYDIKAAIEKGWQTKKKNGTCNSSKLEEELYSYLIFNYGSNNVIRQYNSDVYPYKCDFYIVPLDKYIELNAHWTHGGRPYDPDDPWCQRQLKDWQEKAVTSSYYSQAIYNWTVRDVEKLECAYKNCLHYEAIYDYYKFKKDNEYRFQKKEQEAPPEDEGDEQMELDLT